MYFAILFIWHFKEDPFVCIKYGIWKELFDILKKREIIGSIYPEKLTFDGLSYRTTRLNEAVRLKYSLAAGFSGQKNRTRPKKIDLVLFRDPNDTIFESFPAGFATACHDICMKINFLNTQETHFDKAKSMLFAELYVKNNRPASARNWIGIRVLLEMSHYL